MSESMVDRVAKAISGAPFPSRASRKKARAAIEAMRMLTDNMANAGAIKMGEESRGSVDIWRAMITEALKEPTSSAGRREGEAGEAR